MDFAVAAVKTRLQDFRAIFSFKAAAPPSGCEAKKLSQPIKANKKLGNFRILCNEIPGQGGQSL
ncbi:hypothetical protein [Campylobacter sp.]|uniref:hypothetical protein n=1 Tax=Campylobacter sp. TaxID=205 RepID=UPI002AA93B76|nr:hypothetical protein [Campylobacter sp.]MCI6662070.1 hypothetical protein [Campylobacter sp.]